MKTKILKIFTTIFIIHLCALGPVRGDDLVYPLWQTGDKWVVKAVYPLMKADEWSEPVYWEYEVLNCDTAACTISVTPIGEQSQRLNMTAALTYTKASGTLSLTKAEITKIRRGKKVRNMLTYNKGIPVRTEQTLIPFDAPVFPLRAPSSADFKITREIGNQLRTTEIIRQEVRQVSGELPDHPSEETLTRVRCLKNDGTIFVQYWQNDQPWPVFGQNENMKYWLRNPKYEYQ